MNDEEYKKKKLIKDVIDNPLFESVIYEIRSELGLMMLEATTEIHRVEIFSINRALDRLVGHLTAIANEVKAING